MVSSKVHFVSYFRWSTSSSTSLQSPSSIEQWSIDGCRCFIQDEMISHHSYWQKGYSGRQVVGYWKQRNKLIVRNKLITKLRFIVMHKWRSYIKNVPYSCFKGQDHYDVRRTMSFWRVRVLIYYNTHKEKACIRCYTIYKWSNEWDKESKWGRIMILVEWKKEMDKITKWYKRYDSVGGWWWWMNEWWMNDKQLQALTRNNIFIVG